MVVCYHHLRKHPYVDNGNGWRLSPICCNKFPQGLLLAGFETRGFTQTQAQKQYLSTRLDRGPTRWQCYVGGFPELFGAWGTNFKKKKTGGTVVPFHNIAGLTNWKLKCLFSLDMINLVEVAYEKKSVYQWWSVVANRKMTSFENLWCRNSSPSKPGNEHRIICWVKKLCTTWNAAIPEHAAFKRATQTRDTVSTVQVRRINFKNVGKVVKTKTSKNKVLALIFHQIGI